MTDRVLLHEYVPAPGDRARLSWWPEGCYLDVRAVDADTVYGRHMPTNVPYGCALNEVGAWSKIPDPITYPEVWCNVYADGSVGNWCASRAHLDDIAARDRLAVIHLAADGTVTLEANT